MKGKGSAEGEPLGAGETPCFALGFVVSPAHIGFPFAGEPQKEQKSQSNVKNIKKNEKSNLSLHKNTHAQNSLYAGRRLVLLICWFSLLLLDGMRKSFAFSVPIVGLIFCCFVGFRCFCLTECEKCVAFFFSYCGFDALPLFFWGF